MRTRGCLLLVRVRLWLYLCLVRKDERLCRLRGFLSIRLHHPVVCVCILPHCSAPRSFLCFWHPRLFSFWCTLTVCSDSFRCTPCTALLMSCTLLPFKPLQPHSAHASYSSIGSWCRAGPEPNCHASLDEHTFLGAVHIWAVSDPAPDGAYPEVTLQPHRAAGCSLRSWPRRPGQHPECAEL